MKVTLQLSRELIVRALKIADASDCSIEQVLEEWLKKHIENLPLESLSDGEILALCDYEMNAISKYELRDLLYQHRERELQPQESARLDELLQIYRRVIVRKARATEVAVARGLIERRA